MIVSIYRLSDGLIVQRNEFPDKSHSLDHLAQHDLAFIEGEHLDATHIINNEPVKVESPPPPPPPPPTEAEIIKSLTNAVQRHLDTTARMRNYDNILSLCSYATSTDPVFSAEGQAGVTWRDAVWRRCYEVMADVRAGVQPVPTAEELIASLPVMTWEEQSPV